MNIILDVDDVVLAWHDAYSKKYNVPVPKDWIPYEKIKHHLEELRNNRLFWLTLPLKHMPNFLPYAYVSARGVPVQWTKDALKLRKLPGRNRVYHVPWGKSKIEILKELNCSIFIDDKYETFLECHNNGIFCLLMDTPQNRHHRTSYRINKLDISIIKDMYNTWKVLKND
jgi:uncharacterized HAD superfamily protein